MAKVVIGGKYENQIIFQGNKRHLPAGIRRIINEHFNNWNSLKDYSHYPQLVAELGAANAERFFPDTDWERLNELYERQMQRYTLIFSGGLNQAGPRFVIRSSQPRPARPLALVLKDYVGPEGVLRDNFDIWRVEKLLRRARAHLRFDRGFTTALKQFAASAISFEDSLSFFRQIQAYHDPRFLSDTLLELLQPQIDRVHTLLEPTRLTKLADALKDAGANVRLHPGIEPVLAHYRALKQVGAPAAEAEDRSARVETTLANALETQLYPFQREGVAFLVVNRRALLADDMGLGKTLQAIAGALYLKRREDLRRVLIVCPASLKYQWEAEIRRFTRERCEVISGDKAERDRIYHAATVSEGFVAAEDRPFFFVVNYELVYRDLERLKELKAGLLVLDEAQRVKNFRTKTAKAVFELPARSLFVLTGTPLENQLMELYTIMRFIDERALGRNPVSFRDRYVVTDQFGGITGYQRVEEVSRKIASLTLRRTKEQALDQLPPIVENDVWLELTDVQRLIYQELRGQARQVLSQEAWDSAVANNALTLVQRLREVCDTPELIDPQHTESQKLTELLALLEDEVSTLDRQVIVFTQWTRVGEILIRELGQANLTPSFLHGGIKPRARQLLVERFQRGADRILISTDAGGTGLNLQAASLVVNYDLPFNPAKLNQRIARAHRIGQRQTVFVVNLLCRATVEERLMRILKEKQALFDDVFGDISDPSLARAQKGQQRSLRELLSDLVS